MPSAFEKITVARCLQLLWPYLFEFVCADKYTPVIADICKVGRGEQVIRSDRENMNLCEYY